MNKPKRLSWIAPLLLVGCGAAPDSSQGFRLPDGDVQAGQTAFTELGCVGCHTVQGSELPAPAVERSIEVNLGGKVQRVRTYGELVTAVINPSHDLAKGYDAEAVSRDGESLMANFNRSMTVQQLIDVVAFLQSTYAEYLPRDFDPYFP